MNNLILVAFVVAMIGLALMARLHVQSSSGSGSMALMTAVMRPIDIFASPGGEQGVSDAREPL